MEPINPFEKDPYKDLLEGIAKMPNYVIPKTEKTGQVTWSGDDVMKINLVKDYSPRWTDIGNSMIKTITKIPSKIISFQGRMLRSNSFFKRAFGIAVCLGLLSLLMMTLGLGLSFMGIFLSWVSLWMPFWGWVAIIFTGICCFGAFLIKLGGFL